MAAPTLAASAPDPGVAIWVFVAVVVIGLPVAAIAFARGAGKGLRGLGGGELAIEEVSGEESGGAGTALVREEARQMLEASNARRVARGEEPLDVETEIERLMAPGRDEGLREEVEQLVAAQNERRRRKGQKPLDVEAEVERRLADID